MALAKDLILDPATLDLDRVVADHASVLELIPQRFEMEQLTAIVHDDGESGICAGYKDVTEDEFWVRGHMPGAPLMPGVLMCEAAAQLCTYHVFRHRLMDCDVLGFGGLDGVRFRSAVLPGSRLVIVAQKLQVRPKMMIRCRFQCFVESQIVCEGQILGTAIPKEAFQRSPTGT